MGVNSMESPSNEPQDTNGTPGDCDEAEGINRSADMCQRKEPQSWEFSIPRQDGLEYIPITQDFNLGVGSTALEEAQRQLRLDVEWALKVDTGDALLEVIRMHRGVFGVAYIVDFISQWKSRQ
jgi:hypothetical protein